MGKKILVMCVMVFWMSFMVNSADSKIELLGISPGSDLGAAVVDHRCPTFSWTSVDWASGYKLVVFVAQSEVMLTFNEMAALQTPVLQKQIRGKALAWTPSSMEGLTPGLNYIWYVQARDEYGGEVWSQGRSFRVELPVIPRGVEEEIRNKLKEQGLDDENINNVFSGVSAGDDKGKTESIPDGVAGYEGSGETYFGYLAGNGTAGTWNSSFGEYAGNDLISGGTANMLFGRRAGENITTGDENCLFGYYAGADLVTGIGNSLFGNKAGQFATGSYNTMIGWLAGDAQTSGTANTFVGVHAGGSSTTASYNVFIGGDAGYYNTTGNDNTFVGYQAGYDNSTGHDNTLVGDTAGANITTGSYNVFMGTFAGDAQATASGNTFVGYNAGGANTSGYDNSFFGYGAGDSNTTGYENTAVGDLSGTAITTGDYNSFFGSDAGDSVSTGNFNTLIGSNAGQAITSGSSNVCIGYNAGGSGTYSNRLYIDNSNIATPLIYGDFSTNDVQVNGNLTMSNTGTTTYFTVDRTDGSTFKLAAGVANTQIGSISNHGIKFTTNNTWKMQLNANGTLSMADGGSYNGTWNDASSIEYKENIRELSSDEARYALEELNPVIYNYKKYKDEERAGFIAEHVPEIVANNDRKNISTMDIVAVLTKVVKEQQASIAELKEEVKKLKKEKK